MLVTADTNIWISALNFNGKPRRLIVMATEGKLELAVSADILEETKRILSARFQWPKERIDKTERDVLAVCRHIITRVQLDVVKDRS